MSAADSTPALPDAPSAHFDLLAIGGGPAGQKAAIQAAKLGRRSAIVEQTQLGGCSVFTGTIPSKTLREAVLYLTGFSQRSIYGQSYRVKDEITMEDPVTLEKPWTVTYAYRRMPDYTLLEYICEDNREYADDKGVQQIRIKPAGK